MAGKQKRRGPRRPLFQDVANGVTRTILPQVWIQPWLRARLEVAVEQKQAELGDAVRYSLGAYIREAVREQLKRDLGPEDDAPHT